SRVEPAAWLRALGCSRFQGEKDAATSTPRGRIWAAMPTCDELPRFSHQQILRVLSGVLLCIFLAAIDQTVVIPAVPAIATDLNGFSHLPWIVSAYLLTSTAMTPVYGQLSDIYGPGKLVPWG